MAGYHLTTPTTIYLNRTPTSTLHRVFHRSLTTIKRMTTILKHLTPPPHHHHHIHQMYLCLMILIRRIPAFHLMMMIHFTHHFNHHQDRMMTHQMRKCSHHQTYHLIHHHHQIIHNHCFPEPNPYLSRQTPLSCQTQSFHRTLMIHPWHIALKEKWWSTDTTCDWGSTIANACVVFIPISS